MTAQTSKNNKRDVFHHRQGQFTTNLCYSDLSVSENVPWFPDRQNV